MLNSSAPPRSQPSSLQPRAQFLCMASIPKGVFDDVEVGPILGKIVSRTLSNIRGIIKTAVRIFIFCRIRDNAYVGHV